MDTYLPALALVRVVVLEIIENCLSSIILASVDRVGKVANLAHCLGLQSIAAYLLIEDIQAVGGVLNLGISSSIWGRRSTTLDVVPLP